MSSGLCTVGTRRLFVEDTEQDRPAIVFVHGLGATTNFYEPLVPALEGTYRLVRHDLAGHGRSPLAGEVSVAAFAQDVAAPVERAEAERHHRAAALKAALQHHVRIDAIEFAIAIAVAVAGAKGARLDVAHHRACIAADLVALWGKRIRRHAQPRSARRRCAAQSFVYE